MNKFKIPALIFGAVFIASAAALIIYIKSDVTEKSDVNVDAPAWVHKDGSSGKMPVSGKIAQTGNKKIKKNAENATKATNQTIPVAEKDITTPAQNETKQQPVKTVVDKVQKALVTEIFFDNMASYIADNYHPAGSLPGNPEHGYSSASFKGINTYFGLNLHGLMPEAKSLRTARKEIWKELLAPGTMHMLYETDSSDLLDLIEEKGIMAERKFTAGETSEVRGLTKNQRAEMFRTSAVPLRNTASILTVISENGDLVKAMDGYFKAQKRVDESNGIFQSDLNQSQNSSSVTAKNKTAHSGKVLKDAIIVREKIKTGISSKIGALCSSSCKTPDDLFYIMKWAFRRTKDNPKAIKSFQTGANILNQLADKMDARADLIEKSI